MTVDAGGDWVRAATSHALAIEFTAPTLEASLARAVEGFADALGEIHPSMATERHGFETRTTTPSALLLAVLEEVGLGHRARARPPAMSGGEQQRTALARVLAQQPRIVFADEPTGALDGRSGELVLDKLVEIARRPGRAVLLVTHDPAVAAHCDRVLFLSSGRLIDELRPRSIGEVADVLARLTPATRQG